MLSPHESLLVNEKRGLLGAVLGNPFTNVGILEHLRRPHQLPQAPKLLVLDRHRGARATRAASRPDGNTFYASSTGGQTLAAIDVKDPRKPKRIFFQSDVNYHGLRLSPRRPHDVRRQHRQPERRPALLRRSAHPRRLRDPGPQDRIPKVEVIAEPRLGRRLAAAGGRAVHQQGPALPARGRRVRRLRSRRRTDPGLGARRCGADHRHREPDKHPKVVSNLRLAVHQPGARAGDQQLDPGAADARSRATPATTARCRSARTPRSSAAR